VSRETPKSLALFGVSFLKIQSIMKRIKDGTPWEDQVGYCRAVVVGKRIEIAGTTSSKNGQVQFPGDAGQQTHYILDRMKGILHDAGFSMEDVVRTRMYVTNMNDWERIGEAHQAFFKHHPPAATMVEVSRLIHPDLCIEIELTAEKE
jgi:enamine deaminase RidA (YjgF/YER057c/UK114 family)